MKKLVALFVIACLGSHLVTAQTTGKTDEKFIEVSGTSEMEVVPDEIYITITLMERMEGKEKITIDKQEADLKKHIRELGIEAAHLVLNSANADYGKVRRATKDVLINKSYTLKVAGTDMLAKVYERLDKMNAHDAYISRYTHSKILDYQKENRIKAVKAAKEKAEYLLAALGKKAGAPLQIVETDNYVQDQPPVVYGRAMAYMNVAQNYENEKVAETELSFKKIKIRSGFLVKYEIANN